MTASSSSLWWLGCKELHSTTWNQRPARTRIYQEIWAWLVDYSPTSSRHDYIIPICEIQCENQTKLKFSFDNMHNQMSRASMRNGWNGIGSDAAVSIRWRDACSVAPFPSSIDTWFWEKWVNLPLQFPKSLVSSKDSPVMLFPLGMYRYLPRLEPPWRGSRIRWYLQP